MVYMWSRCPDGLKETSNKLKAVIGEVKKG